MVDARHSRQARLVEIGAEGQGRLAESEVRLSSSGIAGEIEARYLAAAGVGTVRGFAAPEVEPVLSFGITDPAALELARGAHGALRSIRAIVLGGSP